MNAALRPLWRIVGVLALALAVVVTSASMVSAMVRHEESVRRILTAEQAINTLSVSVEIGTIEVVAGGAGQVTIEGSVHHGFEDTELTTELNSGAAVVEARCPELSQWCRVDLRVEVPAKTDVGSVILNGRLLVSDIDGDVRVRGRNLVVDLLRVGGSVDLQLRNGHLDMIDAAAEDVTAKIRNGGIDIAFATAPQAVNASTRNGFVDIALPLMDTAYRVEMAAENGSTDSDIRTDPSSDRSIVARTYNGGVTVRYRD